MRKLKNVQARAGIRVGLGSLLCVSLFVASCGGPKQTDTVNDREAIEKLLAEMIEKANAGDIDAVMSYLEVDAVAMPTNEMPVFGTRLIRPRIQSLFDESQFLLYLTSEETEVSGTVAFARGYIGEGGFQEHNG